MKIVHFEDDKYLVLDRNNLIATFDLEISNIFSNKNRLAWFFIYEEFRGKHYSKKILKKIVKLIEKDKEYLVLSCYNNIKAYSLYKSFGFEECEGVGYNFIYKIKK
jgi:predicted GNAT family N-acyltransferase